MKNKTTGCASRKQLNRNSNPRRDGRNTDFFINKRASVSGFETGRDAGGHQDTSSVFSRTVFACS